MSWHAPLDTRVKKKCKLEYDDLLAGIVSPPPQPSLATISQVMLLGTKKGAHQCITKDEVDEDIMGDDLGNTVQKNKRKLTIEQVKFLEASFNMDLKLEPERKALIAKQLGVRPRQVAIWFQNRRARWKNKQLEQDYETLRTKYEVEMKQKESSLKEHELAMEENKKLQVEVSRLKDLLRDINDSIMLNVRTILHSNDESVMLDEEMSGKSDVASPMKSSYGQSEMQDSEQSNETPQDVTTRVFGANSCVADNLHPLIPPITKLEADYTPYPTTNDVLGSLVQHLVANDFGLEEAYYLFFNHDVDESHVLEVPWNGH